MVTEDHIWKSIKEGDSAAFQKLYWAYADLLFNYGKKMTSNSDLVKDSIQEIFEVLWERKETINIRNSVKSYLFVIFRRSLLKKLKESRMYTESMPEREVDFSIELKIVVEEQDRYLRQELNKAIKTLSPRQKEIVFLRFYENMSFEEISELMSLNSNSLYKLLSAAISRLRKYFASILYIISLLIF